MRKKPVDCRRFSRVEGVATLLTAIVAIAAKPQPVEAQAFRTVALSTQSAPGAAGNFTAFYDVVLNVHGQTALEAYAFDPPTSPNPLTGIWSEGGGTLEFVAGLQRPINGSDPVSNTTAPTINDIGQIAFLTFFQQPIFPLYSNAGIYRGFAGNLETVAKTAEYAPGTPPGLSKEYYGLGYPQLNHAGQIVFAGNMGQNPSDTILQPAMWSDVSGAVDLFAQIFQNADGLAPDEYYRFFNTNRDAIAINRHGATAFAANIGGPTWINQNPTGLWRHDTAGEQLIAREGTPVPNTDMTFSSIEPPSMNDAGQIAFSAYVTNADPSRNYSGIYLAEGDQLTQLVGDGPAPGTAGLSFSFAYQPAINAVGEVAFVASLEGPGLSSTKSSVWKATAGGLELIALQGEVHPESGRTFGDFFPTAPSINAAGQVAFLTDGEGAGGGGRALWAANIAGVLRLIASSGQSLEVAPGDFRTINTINFVGGSGLQDGRRSGFNEIGQIAFNATFTDGSSGVFVSNLVAIPEPMTMILLALCAPVIVASTSPKRLKRRNESLP